MYLLYYLTGFNNYYNRQIKLPKSTSVNDYTDYFIKASSGALTPFTEEVATFNPNDGVMTSIIINYPDGVDDEIDIDYILVANSAGEILSKWFVLDRQRRREGQWDATLRRDIVSDNYDDVINAPCFIEKATLHIESPFIWNKENMTFNQIKEEETLLKDDSGCPWIVGYYAKNIGDEYLHGTVEQNDLNETYDETIDTSFEAWRYNATETPFYGTSTVNYRVYASSISTDIGSSQVPGYFSFGSSGDYIDMTLRASNSSPLTVPNYGGYNVGPALAPEFKSRINQLSSAAETYIPDFNSASTINTFLSYNSKIIKDINGKYFSISIYQTGNTKEEIINIEAGTLFNLMNAIVKTTGLIKNTANASSFKIAVSRPEYKMVAQELYNEETTWDMRGDKFITEDAPYNIFAIPFGNTNIRYQSTDVATSNPVIAMAVANSIIRTMDKNLYDIQLLPYCPIGGYVYGELRIWEETSKSFSVVKAPGGTNPCYILNIPRAKFSKNLYYEIPVPEDAVRVKVMNECEMYRLCSPNYNGAFEFSPAKNGGIEYFNVDCEYKPFQPYIHVNPNFKGMYGRDFNDARGLICNGDFSLAQIKDAWQEYQVQNKNFQEIFSRQIENMEDTRDIKRTQELWQLGAGAATAGMGLAGTALLGGAGPVGAIGAGVVGAGISAIGGAVDYSMSEKLHTLSLDYTKDMYSYNLANIRALPYSLTKISAYNNNNKLFPFVERYSATLEEKEAFKNKLTYNGMSVGAIDYIRNYLLPEPSYIKGSIIRIENSQTLDFHSLSELSNEIYKGVFI